VSTIFWKAAVISETTGAGAKRLAFPHKRGGIEIDSLRLREVVRISPEDKTHPRKGT
jgi:hypothetical protein